MKKLLALLLVLTLALSLAACGDDGGKSGEKAPDADVSGDAGPIPGETITDANGNVIPSNIPGQAVTSMPEYFDAMDFVLYGNIFTPNVQGDPTQGFGGDDYVGQEWVKQGTFAVLRDEWNQRDRYYVWGYADQTRCCDFQWEFIPADPASLPQPGSEIEVRGTFVRNDAALDYFWLENAQVSVIDGYDVPAFDYDLTRCSPTLARVQIQNMQAFPDAFSGKSVRIFGRAVNGNCVQHPYYDGSWQMDITDVTDPAATGMYVIAGGVFNVAEDGKGSFLQASSYELVNV